MDGDLEARLRRLEDRVAIGETVVRYCLRVDRRDWAMFERCFTDPMNTDYDAVGVPAETLARKDLVATVWRP